MALYCILRLCCISFFFCAAKEATVRKIETIVQQQFMEEMQNKEQEIDIIDTVRKDMDKSDNTHWFVTDVITHPCPNFNCASYLGLTMSIS